MKMYLYNTIILWKVSLDLSINLLSMVDRWIYPHSVQSKTMNMAFLNAQHAKYIIYVRAVAGLDPNQEQGLEVRPLFSSSIDW